MSDTTPESQELRTKLFNITIDMRNDNGRGWIDRNIARMDDIMALITADKEKVVREARIEELNRVNTRRHYGKDYQDSLDELDDYKDKRLAELQGKGGTDAILS